MQHWIFSVRYMEPVTGAEMPPMHRRAVVGPARASTVEAALHLADIPEIVRAQIRANDVVRAFIDGRLDPNKTGYYITSFPVADDRETAAWAICIGSVQEILPR